jgi:hypothetical protein
VLISLYVDVLERDNMRKRRSESERITMVMHARGHGGCHTKSTTYQQNLFSNTVPLLACLEVASVPSYCAHDHQPILGQVNEARIQTLVLGMGA